MRQKDEPQNGRNKKIKHTKLPENEDFIPRDTHPYVCVSGGKRCLFFGKFGGFVFLLPPFWDSPFCFITDVLSYLFPYFHFWRYLLSRSIVLKSSAKSFMVSCGIYEITDCMASNTSALQAASCYDIIWYHFFCLTLLLDEMDAFCSLFAWNFSSL